MTEKRLFGYENGLPVEGRNFRPILFKIGSSESQLLKTTLKILFTVVLILHPGGYVRQNKSLNLKKNSYLSAHFFQPEIFTTLAGKTNLFNHFSDCGLILRDREANSSA